MVRYGSRLLSVSYTHLDVYKRQELEVSENLEKELNLRIEELHALLEKERDNGCCFGIA